jgi:hypothetical protein
MKFYPISHVDHDHRWLEIGFDVRPYPTTERFLFDGFTRRGDNAEKRRVNMKKRLKTMVIVFLVIVIVGLGAAMFLLPRLMIGPMINIHVTYGQIFPPEDHGLTARAPGHVRTWTVEGDHHFILPDDGFWRISNRHIGRLDPGLIAC